jgi:hypothetical protein
VAISYNADELVAQMKTGKPLVLPLPPIRGMIKLPDTEDSSAGGVLLAPSRSCAAWIPIPLAMIEKFEHLDNVQCKDHRHEYGDLYLKQPTTSEGQTLGELLRYALASAAIQTAASTPSVERNEGIGLTQGRLKTTMQLGERRSLCDVPCNFAMPGIYANAVLAMKAAKAAGLNWSEDACVANLTNISDTTAAAVAATYGIPEPIASAMVAAAKLVISDRCIKCACDIWE